MLARTVGVFIVACSGLAACGNSLTTARAQGGGASTGAAGSTAATTTSKATSVSSTHAIAATTDAVSTTASGGGFCDGTKVSGTCAQAFFAAAAACLSTLGACTDQITPTSATTFNEDVCWSTGQTRHVQADGTSHVTTSTWVSQTSATCLTSNSTYEQGTYTANGTSLVYDESTGDLTCPDGSSANIGTVAGGDLCPDVASILDNQCTDGTCQ